MTLYGRQIQQFSHPLKYQEEIDDPSYVDDMNLRKGTKKLIQVIGHFSSWWKKEYLTSLRDSYQVTRQMISKENLAIVHKGTNQELSHS